jgi:enoyl-CoA hydratase
VGRPLVQDEDGIRWVTFDRPEVLNAIDPLDLAVVTEAFASVGPEIDAVVLTGTGERAFSAGMHKDSFIGLSPAQARERISDVVTCLTAVRECPRPTLALLNGHCLGAGFELALCCDLRVAHRRALVGLPEVKLGIPSVADAAQLQHYVGRSLAKEMILTGDLYAVGDLADTGLLNAVVPPAMLRATAEELLGRITRHTPQVLAAQKQLFEVWLNTGQREASAVSVDVFAELFADPATLEAVASYRVGSSASPGA